MARVAEQGYEVDDLRIQSFPFHDTVKDFIESHDQVLVVEQNRDAQMRTLLVNELEIDPKQLTPVLHYNGTPINATFIAKEILDHIGDGKVQPIRKDVQAGN